MSQTRRTKRTQNKKRKHVVDDNDDELGPPSEEEIVENDSDYDNSKKKTSKKKKKDQETSNTPLSSTLKTKHLLPFKLKTGFSKGKRKKSFRQIVSKQDLEESDDLNENSITEDENTTAELTYSSIAVGNYSMYPQRKYCDITGLHCKSNMYNNICLSVKPQF